MTYIKGYEDGISAVLEMLRDMADAADVTQALSQLLGYEDDYYYTCRTACALLRSTHQTILEQRKTMVAMREEQQNQNSGRIH